MKVKDMNCPACGSFDVISVKWEEWREYECKSCNWLWFVDLNKKKREAGKPNKVKLLKVRIMSHMEDGGYVGCIPTGFNLKILGCSFVTLQRAFKSLEVEGKLVSFSIVVKGVVVVCYVNCDMLDAKRLENRLNNARTIDV